MTPLEFDTLLERRLNRTRSVLASKAKEYAAGEDRLHNFHVAGRVLGTCPEAALLGFLTKHLVSVLDMVGALPEKTPSPEIVDEKIGDCINYFVLLEALFAERWGEAVGKFECAHEWVFQAGKEFCRHCLGERGEP